MSARRGVNTYNPPTDVSNISSGRVLLSPGHAPYQTVNQAEHHHQQQRPRHHGDDGKGADGRYLRNRAVVNQNRVCVAGFRVCTVK